MIENSKKISGIEIETRMKNNNLLNQERKISLIWMHAISQLQYCLWVESEDFDKKIYLEEIETLNTQIILGQKIIEDIENDIKTCQSLWMKIPNEVFELKWSIQERLNKLEETKQKLEDFLSKIPQIAEYKKNTDKYTKEILEIINII